MKKIILVIIACISISINVFSQSVNDTIKTVQIETEIIKEFSNNSGKYLIDSYNSINQGYIWLGSATGVLIASSIWSANASEIDDKEAIRFMGYVAGGVLAAVGIGHLIKGHIEFGKAGKRLEYEMNVINNKLIYKF